MGLVLEHLHAREPARAAAESAMRLMQALYPICRSITGDGVRRSLDLLSDTVPLERFEVPSGTAVFDWEVPKEWNIREAYVADASGHRVIDFRAHSLHVVSYSVPVRARVSLAELQPHLHSLPEHPDWIPYRTSYYHEDWGFCLRHRDRERLGEGPFDVVIDADLRAGHLTYAEAVCDGASTDEAIIYTHTCHPSLVNDNLTGMAVSAVLAAALRLRQPRLRWRFIFGPGTIGSLTWLARNEGQLARVQGGLVIGLLGDAGPLQYKRSRRGATATDRAAEAVLRATGVASRVVEFEPYGYDERQFCSPGFDLPVGRMTRSPNGGYPEYHSSADDLSLVNIEGLAESIQVLAQTIGVIDANCVPVNLNPKGEPRLGKRDLYGSLGGKPPGQLGHALLWVLNLGDGLHDLVRIAERSGLDFELLEQATGLLEEAGLVQSYRGRLCNEVRGGLRSIDGATHE
jgi:aminopeptidase-like protein